MPERAARSRTARLSFLICFVCLALSVAADPAAASSLQYQLDPGDNLGPGLSIVSPNRLYWLTMENDGNLHETEVGSRIVIGESHTSGNPGTVLFMQRDGNLVLRAPGNRPIWATATDGHPGTVLQIQDDGAVVLYAPGHRALRVIIPTLNNASVPTPRLVPTAPAAPAPGVDKPSEIGADVYDGTRVVGCATAGKILEDGVPEDGEVAGVAEEQLCGMVTNSKGAEVDSYGVFRISGSIAAALKIGGPWGAAVSTVFDILTDAPSAN